MLLGVLGPTIARGILYVLRAGHAAKGGFFVSGRGGKEEIEVGADICLAVRYGDGQDVF